MKTTPNVSIIIPSRNRPKMLQSALESVLSQSYKDYEIIIVADGFVEKVEKVVSGYMDKGIVILRNNITRGASFARNMGIKKARGKYIAFLDDDDEWFPDKLQKQIPLIQNSNDDVGLVYCWMEYIYNGKLVGVDNPQLRGYIFPEMLDKQAISGCPTIIIKKNIVNNIGYFDESLPRGNDGDYWRRITRCYKVDYIPEILVRVNIGHGDRISSNTVQSSRDAINGYKKMLQKYKKEYLNYPDKQATIYMKTAVHYLNIGDFESAFVCFLNIMKGKASFSDKLYNTCKFAKQIIKYILVFVSRIVVPYK